MSTYAVITDKDVNANAQQTQVLLQLVKNSNNIYSFTNFCNNGISKLKVGDLVIVTSISVFNGTANLYKLLKILEELQVGFKSMDEPYLSFTANKPLKTRVWAHLGYLSQFEVASINHISSIRSLNQNEVILLNQLMYRYSFLVTKLAFKYDSIMRVRN